MNPNYVPSKNGGAEDGSNKRIHSNKYPFLPEGIGAVTIIIYYIIQGYIYILWR